MALDSTGKAVLALHRFGLGPRPHSVSAINADPKAAMIAEIERPDAGRIDAKDLLSSADAIRDEGLDRSKRRERREARTTNNEKKRKSAQSDDAGAQAMADAENSQAPGVSAGMDEKKESLRLGPRLSRQFYQREAEARLKASLSLDIGVAERFVRFWSNHFCIQAKKPRVEAVAGAFEREAIRPHVFGRFADMLVAVESHPAMIIYLDNIRSVGPNSRLGERRGSGLNENLAREILELHTLGVRSVYSQKDVTSFAKVITGWTMVPPRRDEQRGGHFEFAENAHEPGPQTVIGKVYPDKGVQQGMAVLADIAKHPATARHIARKLATHFVSDDPPPELVDRLAKRFYETGGDLKVVSRTLLESPEAWQEKRAKLKSPSDWLMSAVRAVDGSPPVRMFLHGCTELGEPLWLPNSPKGFPDNNDAWMDGLAKRLDVANLFARKFETVGDPDQVLESTLGPLASAETRETIGRAEDRAQALTLLFMAPEFQRR